MRRKTSFRAQTLLTLTPLCLSHHVQIPPPHPFPLRHQGGFIWDWVDQGLVRTVTTPDGRSVEAWGYGGDFADDPNDARFCINGMVWPDRTPHPSCFEAKEAMVSAEKK